MTVTEHYAWATVDGVAGTLDVGGGRIVQDVSVWPHVTATQRIPAFDGWYAALDPRTAARRVVLSCGEQVFGLHRQFDLAVRSARLNEDGLIEIESASDEVLLEDYAPDEDIQALLDEGVYLDGPSAWTLSRLALSKIGATLLPPLLDPDLSPVWSVTNLAVNPRFNTDTRGAALGAGASALTAGVDYLGKRALRFSAAAGGGLAYVAGFDPDAATMTAIPVDGGQSGTGINIYVEAATFAAGRWKTLVVQLRSKDNPEFAIYTFSFPSNTDDGWQPLWEYVQIPPGEYYLAVGVEIGTTGSTSLNAWATNVMIAFAHDTVMPFNGSTPNDAVYRYEWDGEADYSTSTRYPVAVERLPESMVWPGGVGGMSWLAPILQTVGMRLVCDEQRVWSLRGIDHVEPGAVSIEYGSTMTGYEIIANLDDWCDAATIVYRWKSYGFDRTQVDHFEAATPPRKTIHREINLPFPGPGRAANIVRRAQHAGRQLTASAVTNWAVLTEQTATIITEDLTLTGTVGACTFDLDTDEMTITLRTQETP